MKKRYRLLLTVVLMAIGFYFLWPSIRWYFIIPQAEKEMAESTRESIRVYASDEAKLVFKALAAMKPDDPVPAEYRFLQAKAAAKYKLAKQPVPSTWTVKTVLGVYSGFDDFARDAEAHYRDYIFALKEMRNSTLQLGLDLRGGMYVTIRADFETLEKSLGHSLTDKEREDKMKGALEVLNNRIDQYGLTEPAISRQGADTIIVEIPGTTDPERVRSFIMGKGMLAFHIVDSEAVTAFRNYQAQNPAAGDPLDEKGALKDPKIPSIIPKGTVLRGVYQKDTYGLDQRKGYTVLFDEVGLSGNEIRDAKVSRDSITGEPEVVFQLTSNGGEIFYKLTSANVNKVLAVVLDDRVKAQATISTAIRDSVRVTGFNQDEANDLALLLRSGSLPVPLEITSQQAIGASLGEDAIRQGIGACLLGVGLVFLFMLTYYSSGGINAIIAQLLNLYFIVAILSVFNFTLTLSSIAGLILNVGMTVDASVLILERIKEEQRLGKSAQATVKAGFDRAFWAIADSNITTIIAAIVLTQMSKGSIQGFAMTLTIGNLSTLFTAVFCSRLIFDFTVDVLKVKRIRVDWRKA